MYHKYDLHCSEINKINCTDSDISDNIEQYYQLTNANN